MTPYQIVILSILVLWPLTIAGLLYLMSRLEQYVATSDAESPREAGLEPAAGSSGDKEVRVVFGDRVVGEPET